jgi:hypothetical protein
MTKRKNEGVFDSRPLSNRNQGQDSQQDLENWFMNTGDFDSAARGNAQCPDCDAGVQIPDGATSAHCPECGSEVSAGDFMPDGAADVPPQPGDAEYSDHPIDDLNFEGVDEAQGQNAAKRDRFPSNPKPMPDVGEWGQEEDELGLGAEPQEMNWDEQPGFGEDEPEDLGSMLDPEPGNEFGGKQLDVYDDPEMENGFGTGPQDWGDDPEDVQTGEPSRKNKIDVQFPRYTRRSRY